MDYTIRPLVAKDLGIYKPMRLNALKTDPGVFRRSLGEEDAMPESFWSERLANPRGTIFGLFDDLENLVGITAIIIEEEGNGYLTHSYLIPEARGKGLSKIFFETRIRWAKDRKLKRLAVNHRRANLASKAAIQKFGFTFLYSEAVLWPDGNTDELLHYELIL